jgi:hypothetical protein
VSAKTLAWMEQLKKLPWRRDPFLGGPIDQALGRWLKSGRNKLAVNVEEVSTPPVGLEVAVNA